jgi:hypothetical protein
LNLSNILGCEFCEVELFGEILAIQAIGIFVEATLPGGVGMSKLGLDAKQVIEEESPESLK